MRKLFTLMVAGLGFCLGSSPLSAQDEVSVGIFNFPPFYTQNRHSRAEGMLIDFANEVFDKANLVADYQIYSTGYMIRRLGLGGLDVAMLIKHPDLEGKVFYSEKPISKIMLMSYRREATPALTKVEDMAGKRVLVISGYGYAGMLNRLKGLDPLPTLVVTSNIERGLDMLEAGRADYFLSYRSPTQAIERQKGPVTFVESFAADPLQVFDVYWVVSKSSVHSSLIMERLQPFYKFTP